jgi:hypothetical protein
LEQYRSIHSPVAKLVVLDEAHKYLTTSDSLAHAVVSVVRQMRHLGMRVAISTQSPLVLPAELLELVSIAVIHRFHSLDWFTYLASKIPLKSSAFKSIRALAPGQCLLFSASQDLKLLKTRAASESNTVREGDEAITGDDATPTTDEDHPAIASDIICMRVRPRLSHDLGKSVRNTNLVA